MDALKVGLVIAALLVALASPVVAQNHITVDYGETWIRWDWSINATLTNIYVDGILAKSNSSQTFYHLANKKPVELHSIAVYNSSSGQLLVEDEAMTLISTTVLYFWMVIIIAMIVLMMILSDMKLRIVVGVMTSGLIVYDLTLAIGQSLFILVAYALVAVVGYFMIMAIYELFEENLKWT